MVIPSCGSSPLSLLTGGGPNVAANTQIGKENNQTFGVSKASGDQKIVRPKARDITQTQDTIKFRTDSADNVTFYDIPPWVILLLVLGWVLPSPGEMLRSLFSLFRR